MAPKKTRQREPDASVKGRQERLRPIASLGGYLFWVGKCKEAVGEKAVGRESRELRLVVGTRGPGRNHLHRLRYSPTQRLVLRDGEPIEVVNPSFGVFHPSGRALYVVNETGKSATDPPGSVSAFAVDWERSSMRCLNATKTGGAAPCYLSISADARHLFVANYWGGSVSAHSLLPDLRIGERTAFIQHHGGTRESGRDPGAHAHSISLDPSGRRAVVADLGKDELLLYRYDAAIGSLVASGEASFSLGRGSGPRHFVFSRDGRRAFVVNELNSTVAVLAFDGEHGRFHLLQLISTRLPGFIRPNSGAEVALSPDGRHLYVSNRGDDTIAVYEVHPQAGTLVLKCHEPTLGRTPRHFALDQSGRYLVVANQESATVIVFARNSADGRLVPTTVQHSIPSPVWVGIAP